MAGTELAPGASILSRLKAVALGREPADLVVRGGALVNVFTEEVQEGWDLAIAEGRVAYIGPEASERAGEATEIVELDGDLAAPGLVEGHTHLTRISLAEMIPRQVAAGVTTCVMEAMELAFICGPAGVREYLAAAEGLPGRLFFTIPPEVGLDPVHDARLAPAEEWIELLDHPRVLGVGEIYWADLMRGHPRAEALVAAALRRGLAVEGHGAGARGPILNAIAAAGVGSDHEGIDAQDVLLRLRLGFRTLARHGATRQDLHAIAPVWAGDGVDLGRLGLVTDGLEPEAIAEGCCLNWVVDQAIATGLPLARAVRMASRNVAEHFGLGRWVGGLAPGMLADLAVVPRGNGFKPRLVLVGGRPPAPARAHRYPDWMRSTVHVGELSDDLLMRPGPGRWRAMELVAPLVTREVESDGRGDLVVAVVDRMEPGRGFRGLLRGFGLEGGAVAWSSGWESSAVLAAGDRPGDMAAAIRRVADMRGGAAVAAGGRVVAEWRAELAGIQSTAPLAEVVSQVTAVNAAARDLGSVLPNPLLSLETLTTPAIPHLRIWPGGYVRLKDGARLGLEWEARPL